MKICILSLFCLLYSFVLLGEQKFSKEYLAIPSPLMNLSKECYSFDITGDNSYSSTPLSLKTEINGKAYSLDELEKDGLPWWIKRDNLMIEIKNNNIEIKIVGKNQIEIYQIIFRNNELICAYATLKEELKLLQLSLKGSHAVLYQYGSNSMHLIPYKIVEITR